MAQLIGWTNGMPPAHESSRIQRPKFAFSFSDFLIKWGKSFGTHPRRLYTGVAKLDLAVLQCASFAADPFPIAGSRTNWRC